MLDTRLGHRVLCLTFHPTFSRTEGAFVLSDNLANLFASKFIARPDAKAKQYGDGIWAVHTIDGKKESERIPWRRDDLEAHIEGRSTFGHYLLSRESKTKLFAFDIDLEKTGSLPSVPFPTEDDEVAFANWEHSFTAQNLREAWLNRAHPARDFMKLQFKQIAHKLLKAINEELGLSCAAAYSGGKGIHVYGFTGLIDAGEARLGAQIVLDSIGEFKPLRGENFFHHPDYPNLSVEVFPKQNNLDGKDLGNLMRLPLGKNLKAPQEPTFFIDMTAPMGVLQPMNPETALLIESPWTPF
jgi:hypothetical protein